MNIELKNRVLSLLWRGGVAAIVAFIAVVSDKLPGIGLPEMITAVIILVLNEVTKYLNKKYQLGARVLGKAK